jgi:hypothetical protein
MVPGSLASLLSDLVVVYIILEYFLSQRSLCAVLFVGNVSVRPLQKIFSRNLLL